MPSRCRSRRQATPVITGGCTDAGSVLRCTVASTAGNHRQNHLRWMAGIVIDRVVGRIHAPVVAERVAGVGIDVEPRIIAARYVDPDAVPFLEDIGGRIERDRDRDDVARVQRRGLVVEPFAVTGAQDRVAQVEVKPERIIGIGGNLVDQLGGEIGIGRGRADPELDLDRAGDFQVGLERARSETPGHRGARRAGADCRPRGCRREAAGRSRHW